MEIFVPDQSKKTNGLANYAQEDESCALPIFHWELVRVDVAQREAERALIIWAAELKKEIMDKRRYIEKVPKKLLKRTRE